jgi:hypothetical protein
MPAQETLGDDGTSATAPAIPPVPVGAPSESAAGARPAPVHARSPLYILIIVAGVFAVSLLKGLRMPNLWSATHMTFNYTQGFIRRGLFGHVLRALGGRNIYQYNKLALCAVVMFALAVLAMARLVRRMLATDGGDRGLVAATLVFAASPGIVFLAHEIGYLDYVGFIAVPLFIAWSSRTARLWPIFYVAAALSVVLALIHESMIIMFAPAMWLVLVSHAFAQNRARSLSRRTRWMLAAHVAGAALVALATSSVIGTLGTKSPERIHALQASIQRYANFPLRGDGFEALYRPVNDNLLQLMPWFWKNPDNQRYLIDGLLASLPGLIALSVYGVRLIARLPLVLLPRLLLGAMFLGATMAPELLNFVGWDSARWNTISFFAAFCCIAALRLRFPPDTAADPRRYRIEDPWAITLAAAGIVSGLTADYPRFLFDGYVVRWFPFDTQWRALLELIHGNFRFLPGG